MKTEKKTDQINSIVAYYLSLYYQKEEKYEKSFKILKKFEKSGNPLILKSLGDHYLYSLFVHKNVSNALHYYDQSYSIGLIESQRFFIYFYFLFLLFLLFLFLFLILYLFLFKFIFKFIFIFIYIYLFIYFQFLYLFLLKFIFIFILFLFLFILFIFIFIYFYLN